MRTNTSDEAGEEKHRCLPEGATVPSPRASPEACHSVSHWARACSLFVGGNCVVSSNLPPTFLSEVRGREDPGQVTETKHTPASGAMASVELTFPRDDTRSLRFPLTFSELPERYRVRVFFRAWQVASGGLFWSVFCLFWAAVLRRLARWQGPWLDPQGTGLCVARGKLVTLGDGVEAGPMAIGFFCFPEPGE